ncbi:MAG: hypothetical protein ACQ5SW_04710 [Sphaerochaetaceae bacterium]
MADQIKCGRITYDLVDGDTIMDNGSCLQLVTRNIRRGWHSESPMVSKAAFVKFKKNPNVVKKTRKSCMIKDGSVTLWIYRKIERVKP